jgi:hypothetical protein
MLALRGEPSEAQQRWLCSLYSRVFRMTRGRGMSSAPDLLRWKAVRGQWLKQVAGDADLDNTTYKVAFFLAQVANDKTHECWPQLEKLSHKGFAPQRARKALADLVGRGHAAKIESTSPKGGRTQPQYYRLIIRKGVHP